jgi:hypothetical protein
MGTMNAGEKTRLDRIEEKIDKLADAVVSIARAEEKLAGLEQLNIEQHRKLQDVEDRLRVVETKVHDVEGAVGILNKIFWIAITALVTGSVAMIFWGTPSL